MHYTARPWIQSHRSMEYLLYIHHHMVRQKYIQTADLNDLYKTRDHAIFVNININIHYASQEILHLKLNKQPCSQISLHQYETEICILSLNRRWCPLGTTPRGTSGYHTSVITSGNNIYKAPLLKHGTDSYLHQSPIRSRIS